ncbi:MAG TPA: CHAT domain-containing tetratricopeptide repeat protein [Thermoanaerobaculia bacterium]|nr:CHAT domain-containing tetratricopeptide repeat protein [Thermoanaerobaculia bacterium]
MKQAEYAAALGSYRAARREFRASRDGAGEAVATEGMAGTLQRLARFDESKPLHGQALSLFRATGDLAGQAEVLANLGLVYRKTGDTKEALPRYETALALFEDLGDVENQVILLNNLGQLVLDMGLPDEAATWFQKALQIKSDLPEVLDTQMLALSGLGMADYKLGHTHLALVELRRARESTRTERLTDYARLVSLNRLAAVLLDAGQADHGKLKWAREAAEKARVIAQRSNYPADEAFAIAISAWSFEFEENHQKALEIFTEARGLFRGYQDKAAESGALFGIARAERNLGHLAQAQDAMESSLALVERLRGTTSSLEMRSSYWSWIRPRYEFYIDMLMELDRLEPGKGHDIKAFEVSESARARTILDELAESGANMRANADPKLLEQDASLRREIEQLRLERQQKISQQGGSGPRPATGDLDQKLLEAIARHEVIAAGLRASSSGSDELLEGRPRLLSQIQSEVLDRDTILLSYWLGEKESILWRVDRHSLRSFRLPGREQIQSLAIKLRDHFASGSTAIRERETARTAARLGEQLLGPVAGQLDATHLLILPDGALRYVPFAALAPPGAAAAQGWPDRPLIVDHDIVSLPSASALSVLRRERAGRRPAPHALAVLADPVFRPTDPHLRRLSSQSVPSSGRPLNPALKVRSLPDLPYSGYEAQEILRLVPPAEAFPALGFDASLETATSPKLGLYRFVHFATHSLMDERPDLSGLVLSQFDRQGRSQDGFLSALDLYTLNLPVELVVLSACQTNQGEDPAGEGIGRLTRGFLYAGARRVAVTLWSIRDKATADLMIHFYRGLLRDRLSPAAALRQAQLSMRADKRWRSPYYWAGFVLQGEW